MATTYETQPPPELTAAVAGPVLAWGDGAAAAEVAAFNAAVAHRPMLTVGATSAADVAATVRWAARRQLPIAVQATGHGAVEAVEGGVLITTRRMRGVSVDPAARVARVEAGAKMQQIIAAAAPYGLAPLVGSSSDAGAVGYTTGGGLPVVGRTFGYAADQINAFEIVTADGRVRKVDARSETDLFWAVRGGKGNFGVVTSMEINLLPITNLYAGTVYYPAEAVASVLRAFAQWAPTLPDEVTTAASLLRLPPLPFVPPPLAGKLTVGLRFAYVGDPAEGERLLEPMRSVAPALIDTVGELPYTRSDEIFQDPADPLPFWEQGALLRELPEQAVDRLLEVGGDGVETPLVMIDVRLLGGALARPQREPNAVAGRDAAFTLWVLGVPMPEIAAILPGAGAGVLNALGPWCTGGSLLNFCGAATAPEQMAAVWEPDVYARLRAIKKDVDSANMFRPPHNIPPAA